MKISTMASGGQPGVNLSQSGPSATKIAAAKAIAAGDTPIAVTQHPDNPVETDKKTLDLKKIKMKTNASVYRDALGQTLAENATVESPSAKTDTNVSVQAVEEPKPLSPQVAALAKERRAIQKERVELDALKKELALKQTTDVSPELITKLKAKPLSTLQELGVTYDQLTEELLGQSSGINPEIQSLKEEIKALKEGVDKNLQDRDTQAEQQVLSHMRREADQLARQDDTFELVREERATPDVIRLIHETFKQTGEVLDVTEAMQLVEDELLKDNLRRIKFKKIQSQITPRTVPAQQPTQGTMRTLTNRDSASAPLDRKQRAMLAMTGQLRKG